MGRYKSGYNDAPDPTTFMEFEWGKDCELMVEAEVNWEFAGHDGIGAYEYWGSNCYDEGDPVWEICNIMYILYNENGDEITPTPEMDSEIREYIANNAEPDL